MNSIIRPGIAAVQYLGAPVIASSPASVTPTSAAPTVVTITAGVTDTYIFTNSNTSWSTSRALSSATLDAGTADSIFGATTKFGDNTFLVARAWLPFDTSAIPVDAIITDIKLRVTVYTKSGAGEDTQVVTTTVTSPSASSFAIANWGAVAIGTLPASVEARSTNEITLSDLSVVNKGGMTYLGIRGRNDIDNTTPTGVNSLRLFSANSIDEQRPKLIITYH